MTVAVRVDDTPTTFNHQLASNGVISGGTKQVEVEPTSLTFTSDDWSTPKAIEVRGLVDRVVDGSTVRAFATRASLARRVRQPLLLIGQTGTSVTTIALRAPLLAAVSERDGATFDGPTNLVRNFSTIVDTLLFSDRGTLAGLGPLRNQSNGVALRGGVQMSGSEFVLRDDAIGSVLRLSGGTYAPVAMTELSTVALLAGRGDDQLTVDVLTSSKLQRVVFDGGMGDDRTVLQATPSSVFVVAIGGVGADTCEVVPLSAVRNVLGTQLCVGAPPRVRGTNVSPSTAAAALTALDDDALRVVSLPSVAGVGTTLQPRVLDESHVVGFGGAALGVARHVLRVHVEPRTEQAYVDAAKGWRLNVTLTNGTSIQTRLLAFGATAFELRRTLCAALFLNNIGGECVAASDGDQSLVVMHVPAERALPSHVATRRDVYYVQFTGMYVAASLASGATLQSLPVSLAVQPDGGTTTSELLTQSEWLTTRGGVEYARIDRVQLDAPGDGNEVLLVRANEATRGVQVALGSNNGALPSVERTVIVASGAVAADAQVADAAPLRRPAGSLSSLLGSISVTFAASSTRNRVVVSDGDDVVPPPASRIATLSANALDGLSPIAGVGVRWSGGELGRGLLVWMSDFAEKLLISGVPTASVAARRVTTLLDVGGGNDLVELRLSAGAGATPVLNSSLLVVRGAAGDDVLDGDEGADASQCIPMILFGGPGKKK